MKNIKRLLAVCLSLSLLMSSSMAASAQAASVEDDSVNPSASAEAVSSTDNNIKILYQDENVVLYQSKGDSSPVAPALVNESNYGNKWVDKTSFGQTFTVPCTYTGKTGVTWKVESSSNQSYAQIYMINPLGLIVLNTKKVYPSDGDVHLQLLNATVGNYTVHFDGYTTVGMRVMCWMYQ